jgi:hypothetical protein
MLSFKQYLNVYFEEFLFEALDAEQSKIVSQWVSDFKSAPKGPELSKHLPFDETGRLDIPLERSEPANQEIHPEVKQHLEKKGFSPVSSTHAEREIETIIPEGPRKGEVVRKKQQQKIGALLSDNPDLQKKHAAIGAKAGAKSGDFSIEIRRDPNGVAEMSSGNKNKKGKESWVSCMGLPDKECNISGGMHHRYIKKDIEHGTHVAYIQRNGRRIGRVALKPFVSERGHTILRPEPNIYGQQDANGDAQRTISAWAERNFPAKEGHSVYTAHPETYDDKSMNSRTHRSHHINGELTSDKIHEILKLGEVNSSRAVLNSGKPAEEHFRTAYGHEKPEIRNLALEHPDAPKDILDHALSGDDHGAHEAAMRNKNLSDEYVAHGLLHPSDKVKAVAINHKKAKEQSIRKILNDPSSSDYIRDAASKRLKRMETAKKLSAMRQKSI